jgi:hypothetical protein
VRPPFVVISERDGFQCVHMADYLERTVIAD